MQLADKRSEFKPVWRKEDGLTPLKEAVTLHRVLTLGHNHKGEVEFGQVEHQKKGMFCWKHYTHKMETFKRKKGLNLGKQ